MADPFAAYPLTAPPVPAAPIAKGIWDAYPLVPSAAAPQPREAKGFLESAEAGLQGSAPGLAWRRRMPDLIVNPDTAKWWERAASSFAHVGAELLLMIGGAMVGGPAGAAAGTAVGGPPGAVAGGLLGAGAMMGIVPATIRQSLIEAYKSGEISTAEDWFNAAREVAKQALKEGAINAAAMGVGAVAGRVVGSAIAPAVGQKITARTFAAGTETADLATQIATMVTMPAGLEGRLPKAHEFLDAAILIGGLKFAHVTASRMMQTYQMTGKTPLEQVADAKADPKVAEELARPPEGEPQTMFPEKLGRLVNEAELLGKGGVDEAPNIKQLIKELKDAGPLQGDMVTDIDRIGALNDQARQAPLTNPERAELEALRTRLKAVGEGLKPPEPTEPSFTADQTVEAGRLAAERLAELEKKATDGQLTDRERTERVFLANARPEAIAKHFKLEPTAPSIKAGEDSAQRVHDDILKQLRDVDQARRDSGLQPLGDDHANMVAPLVRARVKARAARLGVLPETLYAERPLQIRDETAAEVAAAEAAIPEGAPTFIPPEVDLFGAPIVPVMAPRHLSENIPVQALPVASLKLSMDVPQFKKDADEKGVVQPLGGDPDPRGWAVQVWERLNGDLEVISGRHRLELWQRKGLAEIPTQVHREADGFTKEMAARLDAELNIRDEQGSIADYAQYFKDSGLSKETADERGLLARYKGKTGFAIARDGTPDLLAAHRAGVLSDEAALTISSAAPGSERLQALGMAMVQEGKSALIAVNTMKAVELMAAERMNKGAQGDIFGFDDSAMLEASQMAKRASSMQRKISEQISAVSGASKRPELARKMGVDVQDPEGIQKRIVELRQEQMLWDNWPLHPELVARLRAPEVTGREGDLKQGAVDEFAPVPAEFELKPETPAELAARNAEAEAQARRKLAEEAPGGPRGRALTPEERKAQADLFNTQGTLFQSGPAERWYSELGRQIEAAKMKQAPAQGWKDLLKGMKGVKAEEIKWSGLEEWLDLQEGKVTKEQVQQFLAGNGVKVNEVMMGERDTADSAEITAQRREAMEDYAQEEYGRPFNALRPEQQAEIRQQEETGWNIEGTQMEAESRPGTKFSQYVLPGAKEGSYRELLLTLPERADPARQALDDYMAKMVEKYGERMNDTVLTPDERTHLHKLNRATNQPARQGFTSSHFDEPNILAHVRFNEREVPREKIAPIADIGRRLVEAVGARSEKSLGSGAPVVGVRKGVITQGEAYAYAKAKGFTNADDFKKAAVDRVLFIEEIQSDWAQKGKKEGFTGDKKIKYTIEKESTGDEDMWTVRDPTGRSVNFGRTEAEAQRWADAHSRMDGGIPAAPFVGKTDAWVALSLKRMIRYAAENGFDRVAWTTGEQQVGRYTSALRKAVDQIEWTKTAEGVQLVGYKGKPNSTAHIESALPADIVAVARDVIIGNDNLGFDSRSEAMRAILDHRDWVDRWGDGMSREGRRHIERWRAAYMNAAGDIGRQKVVDTTEKEDVLSDAIGKAMADRIINDPNQAGTIEGENIKIDDTGMASFYDRIVPSVAKDVLKKLGGGKISETAIETGEKAEKVDYSTAAADAPRLGEMSKIDEDTFGGVDNFADGSRALYGEATLRIEGEPLPVAVMADVSGIHIVGENAAGTFEVLIPRGSLPDDWTAGTARAVIQNMWSDTISGRNRWEHAMVTVGEIFKPAQSKQQSFEITPAMREKAMEGLPLFQRERGSYQIAEKLITTMQGADKSTVIHELGHDWLEEMRADAARPDAPAGLKADWETLRRELAIGEDGPIERASHEQFARSVERYLGEGEAPSAGLRAVFEKFKAWLLEIYQTMANLNVRVNPELKAVLDRMLATDQEIADARELNVPRAYVAEAKVAEARKIVPGFKAEQVALEPYADELPKGPGEAPDNSHVNYAGVDGSTRIKLTLQRLAEIDQANIQKARGGKEGVETWQEEQATMEKWVLDTLGDGQDKLGLIRGGDPNDPKTNHMLRAKKQLMVGAGHESERLREVILEKGHNATIEEQLQYLSSIELLRQVHAEFLGERAAVARAMNALKDTTQGSAAINSMLEAIGRGQDSNTMFQSAAEKAMADQAMLKVKLDEILLRYNGKSVLDIAKLHKEIGSLKGTFKLAEALEKATKWEMVVEGWKAGLLSGPVTHTTNLFGTQAFMFMRPAVDALAATIGMARGASPGMGESDRASMSGAVARLTGMLAGVQDGVKDAYHTFKLDDPTGKTEAYRTAIPGRAGELIRIPLRLMGAGDAMNTTMYSRGELWDLAIRQAFDEGLNPATREFADRVSTLKDSPTPEMEAIAAEAAKRMTFNMPLGEKGVYLQLFVNKWNLQWMIPFIRTPINITKEVARMSPFAPLVGEWRADMAKGGVARDRALAEAALGAGIMALTMAYAFSGDITGGGSPDPGKNRGKAGVEQPYSWKFGDTYYEYARIQPMGTLMGMAADMAVVWDHMNDEEKDKIPKLLARAFSNAVTNQTFLQGITNVINAMSEPARFAPKFLQQLAGSAVPNIIGQPTAMADPVVREVNSALEQVMSRVPGFRQELMPKRDWLGEEVKTKERLGVVGPVRELKVSEDKVRLEAARLDISMSAPPKKTHIGKGTGKLGDVELTPEERNKFQEVGGKMAHRILANIVNTAGYDALPPLVQKKIFARVLTASHQVAAVAAMPPEKRNAYLQSITERVAQELTPTEE